MTEPLSPAAQAVLDAAYTLPLKNGQPSIAAALRALADELLLSPWWFRQHRSATAERLENRRWILAIAAELEGQQ